MLVVEVNIPFNAHLHMTEEQRLAMQEDIRVTLDAEAQVLARQISNVRGYNVAIRVVNSDG